MQSTKNIEKIYYLLTSLFWLAVGLPLALSILFIQSRGISLFQVGLLMAVYSLVVVLLEVPTGGLADAIGRKKVALLAYSVATLSSLTFLLSFYFPMILLGFILMGVGRALSSGALDAWFVDAVQKIDSDTDLQPLFSKAGTFTLLSLGISTLIGSTLPGVFASLPADGTAILTPLSMPILVAIFIKLILIFSTATLVKETMPDNRVSGWKSGYREIPQIITTGLKLSRANQIILLLLGIGTASGFALAAIESFWQPHFASLLGGAEGNSYIFGIIMGGNFIVGMLGNMLANFFSKLFNKQYALVGMIFQGLWGVLIFVLGLVTNTIPAMLVFWLVYLSMGVTNSPYQTMLNLEIPSEQRSAMLSIASLFNYLGAMGGAVITGFVADNLSIPAGWQIAGVLVVLSLILYWNIHMRSKEKEALPVPPSIQTADTGQ